MTNHDNPWQPQDLTQVEIDYYRGVLATHTEDLKVRQCPVCHVSRCADWRNAYDRLAEAGQPMTDPSRWEKS